MSYAVGAVMIVGVLALVRQLLAGAVPRWGVARLAAPGRGPIALATTRVLPNAVRLGGRGDAAAVQSELARGICRDHLLCLAAIAAFLALQLSAA